MFGHIFNTQFNLSFRKLNLGVSEREHLIKEKHAHLATVDKIRQDFKDCKSHARENRSFSRNLKKSQEMAFCIHRHIADAVPEDTRYIILYSDRCSGQTRNIKTTLMLKWCLQNSKSELQSIERRFFASGHSYNSCDRSFGTIEKEKRTEHLFIPPHWYDVMKKAKKSHPKFQVIEMKNTDFTREMKRREMKIKSAKFLPVLFSIPL